MNKRLFDIISSLLLLAIASWLFVVIAGLYAITFQFPVFFIQERIGKNEKAFRMIKFRTLKPGDQPPKQRRFWLGDVLRFTSLDELPQLINILKGDMSVVGPRPMPVTFLPHFSAQQRRRHEVMPGLTGWAQVNGRNSISWQEKFRLDVDYVEHVSFALDVKILLKTVLVILSFRKDVSLDQEEFRGEGDK